MKTKRILLLVVNTFLVCVLSAQVTIGSDLEPNRGALLDLKSQSPDPTTNVTAIKGLNMPRVALADKGELFPMYSYADATGIPTSEDLLNHKGLLVYNVTEDACALQPLQKGMYVWDGQSWQLLNNVNGNVVREFTDARDGEKYLYSDFGIAGSWMIQNLRYKGNMLPAQPSAASDMTNPLWCYPMLGGDGTDPSAYNKMPSMGLLYNWPAASNRNQGGQQANDPNQPKVQGICPNGWHLPSDYEWNVLEQELYNNSTRYSTYTATGGVPQPTYNGMQSDIGVVMMSGCKVPGALNNIDPNMTQSFSVAQGGFAAMLVGRGHGGHTDGFGEGAYFHTSMGGSYYICYRYLSSGFRGIERNQYLTADLQFSVRCKKD